MLYGAGGLLVVGGLILGIMVLRRKSTATEHQALVMRGGGNMPRRGYANPSFAPNDPYAPDEEAAESAMADLDEPEQQQQMPAPARKKKTKTKTKDTQLQQGTQWRSSVRGPHNQPDASDPRRIATEQGRKVYILDPYGNDA